jgi:hypothetical protein
MDLVNETKKTAVPFSICKVRMQPENEQYLKALNFLASGFTVIGYKLTTANSTFYTKSSNTFF